MRLKEIWRKRFLTKKIGGIEEREREREEFEDLGYKNGYKNAKARILEF